MKVTDKDKQIRTAPKGAWESAVKCRILVKPFFLA